MPCTCHGCAEARSALRALFRDNSDALHASCGLVLEVLADGGDWNGRIHLTRGEKIELLSTIESCASDRCLEEGCAVDGKLHLKEILDCIEQEKCRRFLLDDMPESLACLASGDLVTEAFRLRDKDQSGLLDRDEWLDYLNDLENLHHSYLLANAFRQFRAFFGRGQHYISESSLDTGLSSNQLDKQTLESIVLRRHLLGGTGSPVAGAAAPPPSYSRFQWGLDPEWASCRQDFLFYSANNHPLHGIFSCSPHHPLSRSERLAMEVVTIIFTYFTLWLAARQGRQTFIESATFNTLYVTLPGIVLWWVLFLLFTCPKLGIVDEAVSSTGGVRRAHRWRLVGATLGYFLLAGVFACVLALCALDDLGFGSKALMVLQGRAKGYVIGWCLQTFVYFNPVVAWGQPGGEVTAFGFLGDCVGLGQWRIERQRFQSICGSALQAWDKSMHREQLLRDRNLWMRPRSVVWEYEAGDGYKPYEKDCSEFIERKFQRFIAGHQSSVKVTTAGMRLTVDFEKMTQSAAIRSRKIRRREGCAPACGSGFPSDVKEDAIAI